MSAIIRPLKCMTIPSRCRAFSDFKHFWSRLRKIDNGKYSLVVPGNVSQQKQVPPHINRPSYHESGQPTEFQEFPEIKNAEQIAKMRASCKLAANILQKIENFVKVGVSTDEIDSYAHNLIVKSSAYPSPLNYKFFPKSLCTSVNNVACHGIPDDRKLEDGDIVNVDITVFYEGYHGDCSRTFLIGNVDAIGKELVAATEKCLESAISICKPGCKFCHIGAMIESTALNLGFNVVPAFIGHGIGHYFHGPPDIVHIRNEYPGEMQPGMTFTIEPVLSSGGGDIVILDDEWTAVTYDNARTAQVEHTVLITESGVEVLTIPAVPNEK